MKPTLLAVLAVILLPLACQAQSTLTFAKAMQPEDFSTTGIAIVNPGASDAAVTFSLYGTNGGAPQQVATQTIPARGQLARLASQLFPAAASPGWMQATSGTAGLQGFWFGGDLVTSADGAEATPAATGLVMPLVAPQSEIDIVNTGTADVMILIHLLNADGFEMAKVPYPQSIAAKGFFKRDVLSLFAPVEDLSFATHLRIECRCPQPSPFAATLTASNFIAGRDSAVINGVPASSPTTTFNFPHVVDGPQGTANWKSIMGIVNMSASASNDVRIEFMSENGTRLGSRQLTLPPNGAIGANIRDFFLGFPSGFQNGWVRASSANGVPLTGYVVYAETNAGGVAVVPPQQDGQTNLLFAQIADLPPWFTGLSLLNANTTAANIEVFALNPNGSLIGSAAFALQPGAKTSKLLSEIIPQTQRRTSDGGFVFIRSNVRLFGIELFFSRSLTILANVAAGKILPGITYTPPAR